MRSSENINELAAALAKAQSEMSKAVKGETNSFFKSKYSNLSSIMEACFPALNSNGLSVSQIVGEEEGKMVLETILLHSSGQFIASSAKIIFEPDPKKNPLHALGSAITYMRRYTLAALVGVQIEDDDGNSAFPQQRIPVQERIEIANGEEIAELLTLMSKLGEEESQEYLRKVIGFYNLKSLSELPKHLVTKIKHNLMSKIEAEVKSESV